MINETRNIISMVGLSVVLEGEESSFKNNTSSSTKQVMLNKAAMVVVMTDQVSSSSSYVVVPPPCHLYSPSQHSAGRFPASRRPPVFLDVCFLCKNELLPGKDIYMYKGDRGFCSVECRCRQILLDEQADAAAPPNSDHCSTTSSRRRKMTKNRDGNGS